MGAASRVPVRARRLLVFAAFTTPSTLFLRGKIQRDAQKCIDWARGLATLLEPFGASDTYVNYLGDEGASAVRASYGPNYEKLARLKKKYDPENFFCFNQNIAPES